MLKFNIYSVHLVIFQCPEDSIKPKYRQIKISYKILIIIKISRKELFKIKGYGNLGLEKNILKKNNLPKFCLKCY